MTTTYTARTKPTTTVFNLTDNMGNLLTDVDGKQIQVLGSSTTGTTWAKRKEI